MFSVSVIVCNNKECTCTSTERSASVRAASVRGRVGDAAASGAARVLRGASEPAPHQLGPTQVPPAVGRAGNTRPGARARGVLDDPGVSSSHLILSSSSRLHDRKRNRYRITVSSCCPGAPRARLRECSASRHCHRHCHRH